MLTRLAHRLSPACWNKSTARLCTLKQRRALIASQHASAGSSKAFLMSDLHARSLPQTRRSLRTRTAVVIKPTSAQASNSPVLQAALLSDDAVTQEEHGALLQQAPAGPAQKPLSRKRKHADAEAGQTEQAAAAATHQPPAGSSGKTKAPRKQHSKAPAAATSVVKSDPELDKSADEQAKATKPGRPEAKTVIKTETVTAAKDDVAAQDHDASGNTKEPQSIAPAKANKQRKPRKSKAVVKTETVTVTEATDIPEQQSTADTDESAQKKKPRKPRAKATVSVETLLESVDVVPYRDRTIPKKWVGAHVSMAGGLEKAVVRAASIGQLIGTEPL